MLHVGSRKGIKDFTMDPVRPRPFRASGSLSPGSGPAASARPAERRRGSSGAAHLSLHLGPFLWRWSDRSRWRYPRRSGL